MFLLALLGNSYLNLDHIRPRIGYVAMVLIYSETLFLCNHFGLSQRKCSLLSLIFTWGLFTLNDYIKTEEKIKR